MSVTIQRLSPQLDTSISPLIVACLPQQGSIEVQHDGAGKEHAWHTHPTDETIVVMDGRIKFYWNGGDQICGRGDVIQLPKGTLHGSVALEPSRYIITFATVDVGAHAEKRP